MSGPQPTPVMERILRRTEIVPGPLTTPCWVWMGQLNNRGYPMIHVGSRTDRSRSCRLVYLVAYEVLVGPVPSGLEIDHLCRTPRCWRPDHLEPVTHVVNMARAIGSAAQLMRERTSCAAGHPFDERNTRIQHTRKGWTVRICRACESAASRRYRRRLRERSHSERTA